MSEDMSWDEVSEIARIELRLEIEDILRAGDVPEDEIAKTAYLCSSADDAHAEVRRRVWAVHLRPKRPALELAPDGYRKRQARLDALYDERRRR